MNVVDGTYYKITTTNYISKTSLYTTFRMYSSGPWLLKILMFELLVTHEITTYSWPWWKTGDGKYTPNPNPFQESEMDPISLHLSCIRWPKSHSLSHHPPHHQLCIFHPGNSAFNVSLRIHQAASALKPGETLNPEILRAESEVVFLCSQHVPCKFPVGSHQVSNMLPRFPMCFPRVFPIAPRFNPICFAQSPPHILFHIN